MLPNLTAVIILLHTHASDNHIVHLLCTVFSGKMSVGSSAHFAESGCLFSWYFCCFSCLCILVSNPLPVASFANIFFLSVCYLLLLLMVSFAVQKLSSLIMSHLFIFCFIFLILETDQKYC